MNQLGFFHGILLNLRALHRLGVQKELRRWYLSTIMVSAFISVGVLVLLSVSGAWVLLTQIPWLELFPWLSGFEFWVKGFVALMWTVVMVFVSTFLGSQIASLWVQTFAREGQLYSILKPEFSWHSSSQSPSARGVGYYRRKEWGAWVLSLVTALLFWPFLLLPVLLPLGLAIFAYALGKEAFVAAERLHYDHKVRTSSEAGLQIPGRFYLGLGLPIVLFGLIPILGFLAFPLLRISALTAASPETTGAGFRT